MPEKLADGESPPASTGPQVPIPKYHFATRRIRKMIEKNSPAVRTLAYIGYDATDAPAWRELLQDVFGLMRREDTPVERDEYRLDDRHRRLSVHAADRDGLAYLGWEVESGVALAAFTEKLDRLGVSYEWGTKELAATRAVSDLIVFSGPDDLRLEVCTGLAHDPVPFVPSVPREGFLTGEHGLGHAAIIAGDRVAATRWYMEVLGLRMSDIIDQGPLVVSFLHCNGRHHSLGIAQAIPGMLPAGTINHLMLEARALEDVGRGHDVVMEKGYPLGVTLGQHSNDLMLSFYVYTPSGNQIEYGYGGRIVDSDWQQRSYKSGDIWGHKFQPPLEKWPFPSTRK